MNLKLHIRRRSKKNRTKKTIISRTCQFFYKLMGNYRTDNFLTKRMFIYTTLRLIFLVFLMIKYLPLILNIFILCCYISKIRKIKIYQNSENLNINLKTIVNSLNSFPIFIPHFPFFPSLLQSVITRFRMKQKNTYFYVFENRKCKRIEEKEKKSEGKKSCEEKKKKNDYFFDHLKRNEKIYFEGFFSTKKMKKEFEQNHLCACSSNKKRKNIKKPNSTKPHAIILQHGFNSTSGNKNIRSLCYALKKEMPVFALNNPGLRQKTKRIISYSFSHYLEIVSFVLNSYDLILIGCSMGGCQIVRMCGLVGVYEEILKVEKDLELQKELKVEKDLNRNTQEKSRIEEDLELQKKLKNNIVEDSNLHTKQELEKDSTNTQFNKLNISSNPLNKFSPKIDFYKLNPSNKINHLKKHINFYKKIKISLAITLCTPLSWSDVFNDFQQNKTFLNSIVEKQIVRNYLSYLKRNGSLHSFLNKKDISTLQKLNTLVSLNADDYTPNFNTFYETNSTENFIKNCSIPILMINTVDDILIKKNKILFSDNLVQCEIVGGHLGSIDNFFECFMEKVVVKVIGDYVKREK